MTFKASGSQAGAKPAHVALLRPAAADGVAVSGSPSRARMPGIFKTADRHAPSHLQISCRQRDIRDWCGINEERYDGAHIAFEGGRRSLTLSSR